MRYPADPDDPDHPAAPGVRPFLRDTNPGGRYSPALPAGNPSFGESPFAGRPYDDPSYADLPYADLPYADPSYGDPSYGEPSYGDPSYGDPSYGDPSYGDSSYGDPGPGGHATSLRPFVLTSGRVDGIDPNIGLETQVCSHAGALSARLSPEQRAIVHLCGEPLSVAEISARLRMHFGVTRILVGDLRAAGHLDVHVLENDFPDPETIMRVIRGLRSISS